MDIQFKIIEITNNLNIAKKDKQDIDEYLDHNELGLAFEVLCDSIERYKIKISQKEYELINSLGIKMEMDNNLWFSLKIISLNKANKLQFGKVIVLRKIEIC